MGIMAQKQFSTELAKVRKNTAALRDSVQELLVTGAYYCLKDGDPGNLNRVLEAAQSLGALHVEGITRWVELAAGCARLHKGAFVLNKKVRDEAGIIDEATFAPHEAEMRKVAWYEIAGKQTPPSVFETGDYLKRVIAKLTKEGYADLADEIKQTELRWLLHHATAAGENATA